MSNNCILASPLIFSNADAENLMITPNYYDASYSKYKSYQYNTIINELVKDNSVGTIQYAFSLFIETIFQYKYSATGKLETRIDPKHSNDDLMVAITNIITNLEKITDDTIVTNTANSTNTGLIYQITTDSILTQKRTVTVNSSGVFTQNILTSINNNTNNINSTIKYDTYKNQFATALQEANIAEINQPDIAVNASNFLSQVQVTNINNDYLNEQYNDIATFIHKILLNDTGNLRENIHKLSMPDNNVELNSEWKSFAVENNFSIVFGVVDVLYPSYTSMDVTNPYVPDYTNNVCIKLTNNIAHLISNELDNKENVFEYGTIFNYCTPDISNLTLDSNYTDEKKTNRLYQPNNNITSQYKMYTLNVTKSQDNKTLDDVFTNINNKRNIPANGGFKIKYKTLELMVKQVYPDENPNEPRSLDTDARPPLDDSEEISISSSTTPRDGGISITDNATGQSFNIILLLQAAFGDVYASTMKKNGFPTSVKESFNKMTKSSEIKSRSSKFSITAARFRDGIEQLYYFVSVLQIARYVIPNLRIKNTNKAAYIGTIIGNIITELSTYLVKNITRLVKTIIDKFLSISKKFIAGNNKKKPDIQFLIQIAFEYMDLYYHPETGIHIQAINIIYDMMMILFKLIFSLCGDKNDVTVYIAGNDKCPLDNNGNPITSEWDRFIYLSDELMSGRMDNEIGNFFYYTQSGYSAPSDDNTFSGFKEKHGFNILIETCLYFTLQVYTAKRIFLLKLEMWKIFVGDPSFVENTNWEDVMITLIRLSSSCPSINEIFKAYNKLFDHIQKGPETKDVPTILLYCFDLFTFIVILLYNMINNNYSLLDYLLTFFKDILSQIDISKAISDIDSAIETSFNNLSDWFESSSTYKYLSVVLDFYGDEYQQFKNSNIGKALIGITKPVLQIELPSIKNTDTYQKIDSLTKKLAIEININKELRAISEETKLISSNLKNDISKKNKKFISNIKSIDNQIRSSQSAVTIFNNNLKGFNNTIKAIDNWLGKTSCKVFPKRCRENERKKSEAQSRRAATENDIKKEQDKINSHNNDKSQLINSHNEEKLQMSNNLISANNNVVEAERNLSSSIESVNVTSNELTDIQSKYIKEKIAPSGISRLSASFNSFVYEYYNLGGILTPYYDGDDNFKYSEVTYIPAISGNYYKNDDSFEYITVDEASSGKKRYREIKKQDLYADILARVEIEVKEITTFFDEVEDEYFVITQSSDYGTGDIIILNEENCIYSNSYIDTLLYKQLKQLISLFPPTNNIDFSDYDSYTT